MLTALVDLHGDRTILSRARDKLHGAGDAIHHAINTLEVLADTVKMRCRDVPIYFDLAELHGYDYHTGIVFAALVPEHAKEIARGGRYCGFSTDNEQQRPATGFSADLHTLVRIAPTPLSSLPSTSCILAPWIEDPQLQHIISQLRAQEKCVMYDLPTPSPATSNHRCDQMLIQVDDQWIVLPINHKTQTMQ